MSLSKTHLSLLLLLLVGLSMAASQKESEDMKEICSNLTECRQGMKKWKTTAEALEVKAQKDEKIVEEQKSQLLDALLVMKEQVSFLEKQLQELRNEMKEDTKEIGRQKRQAEECLTDQYWDGRKCEWCTCPTGQQLRADFCGHGVLVGNPGCQDCPPFTYRHRDDNNQTCHRCSNCSDPDASVETPCSFDTDTVCRCRNGFGEIGGHCVSCRDHPNAEGCPPVTTPGIPPEPCPEPSCPEPSCPEIPEDESKKPGNRCIVEWKVGLIAIACSGVSVIIGILAGIPIYKICISRIQSRGNHGTSGEGGEGGTNLQMQNGTRHAANTHEERRNEDAQRPQNREADGLLAANNEVANREVNEPNDN